MTQADRINRIYDRAMRSGRQRRYYGGSDYYNFGWWAGGAATQAEASAALVDRLTGMIPDGQGPVLDVACGLGASTRRLAQRWPAEQVSAINISPVQVEQARTNAPGCDIRLMDATRLDWPDVHFQAVLSVEAAFHFDTREAFFREAFRVLRPGGALVLSDILFRGFIAPISPRLTVPRANLVGSIEDYRALLAGIGFSGIRIEDATDACLGGFRRNLSRWPSAERRAGRMSLTTSLAAGAVSRAIAGYFGSVSRAYLLVSALKPG